MKNGDISPLRRVGLRLASLGVVILAAGASSRMGRPKMLLSWRNTSVIGHVIAEWRRMGCGQIAVVCANGDCVLGDELDRLRFPTADRIMNSAAHLGMFSSILAAARWTGWRPELSQWAIVLGDQPHLPAERLVRLIEVAAKKPEAISQPSIHGRPRHPVVLPKQVFEQLKHSAAENLKQFLSPFQDQLQLVPETDAAFDFDMDRPEDYDFALRFFSHDRIDSGAAKE